MRIGIDIDGVLADHRRAWLQAYTDQMYTHGHETIDWKEFAEHQWRWFRKNCKLCFEYCLYSEHLAKNFPLFDGALEVIKSWDGLHDRYIVTKRPTELRAATETWLTAKEIMPRIIDLRMIGQEAVKSTHVNELELDVFIDDSPAVHDDIGDFCPDTTRIALAHSYNRIIDTDHRVYSWEEIGEIVAALK